MRLEKRKLGSTGFNATVLGIGDLADHSVPLEKCVATIHRAMDFGLNLIDTAPGYENGYSEAIVGAALRDRTATDKVLVTRQGLKGAKGGSLLGPVRYGALP